MNYTLEVGQFTGSDNTLSAPIKLTIDGQAMSTSTSELSDMCRYGTTEFRQFPGFSVEKPTDYMRRDSIVISGNNISFELPINRRTIDVSPVSASNIHSLSIYAPYSFVSTDLDLRADTVDIMADRVCLNPEKVRSLRVKAQSVCFNNANQSNGNHVYEVVNVYADSIMLEWGANVTANDMRAQSLSGLVYTTLDQLKEKKYEELSDFDLRGKLQVNKLNVIDYGMFKFFKKGEPELIVNEELNVEVGGFINDYGRFINNGAANFILGNDNEFKRNRIQGDGKIDVKIENRLHP